MNFFSNAEQKRRKEIVTRTRQMIKEHIRVEDEDETSLTASYQGYYMQLSFSSLHPLLVICLARAVSYTEKTSQYINQLNLSSVLGSHVLNSEIGCYSYRATLWLDIILTPERFFEILSRCIEEANRGYSLLQTC